MSTEELKRIHGEDVELGSDTSEDDKLTEEQALAQAKAEGIEFVDTFKIDLPDQTDEYKTKAEAIEALKKLGEEASIIQIRRQK